MAEYPNLAAGRRALDRIMIDTCRITYDRPGRGDDTWNQATMEYTPGPNDDVVLYEGKCKFTAVQQRADIPRVEGDVVAITRLYTFSIALDAPPIPPGSVVEVLSSVRAPTAVGQKFRVLNETEGTFQVSRRISTERILDALPGVRGA